MGVSALTADSGSVMLEQPDAALQQQQQAQLRIK
jgi:hypothetical protein